jgi:hypothetical protein
MENYSAIEKEWITVFEGTNAELILTSLYEIRNSGSVKILPVLFGMIHKDSDTKVRNEIIHFIGELKTQEAASVIAGALEARDYGDYICPLVAACWQSGLDFSKHLRVFARLFIQADYKTALEAFTVIEESLPGAEKPDIHDCIHFLQEAQCMVTDEKLPLYLELRKVVEAY